MKRLAPVALCILAACSSPWPPHGRGGMAESGAGRLAIVEDIRLTCARERIEVLTRQGVETAFPAMLHVANLQWTRAARAQAGGMDLDATEDLERLKALLDELQGRLSKGTGEFLLASDMTEGCIS